ncbi:hypothetical protein HZA57_01825 [Candidatus Poribacteria bacterium]|nr:hypothetical protein [Candidatus Poribacteria bacterium]
MRSIKLKGVLCLEDPEWEGKDDEVTVEGMFEFLRTLARDVDYAHRNVSTESELQYYVKRWTQKRFSDCPVLYLGFHGTSGQIWVHDCKNKNETKKGIPWEDIINLLKGTSLENRWIHFGSCSTVNVHGKTVASLLEGTGLLGLSGYRSDVRWLHSYLVEVAFFRELLDTNVKANRLKARLRALKTCPWNARGWKPKEKADVQSLKALKKLVDACSFTVRLNPEYV